VGGGVVEVLGLEQGVQFGLVGQDDVGRGLDELEQLCAPAVHHKAVRQGDGDLAARRMGGGGGGLEGGAGRGRVEQIAFQIDDGAVADHARVDVGRGKLVGGAQEGAHGALAVRRDVDQATTGAEALARAVFQHRGVEVDADGADVVAEDLAQRVFRHLADIGGAPAERADARHGVARRTARGLDPRRHGVIQGRALFLVDQLHRAGDQALGLQEGRFAWRQDVDDGVAQGADVEAGVLGEGGQGLGHVRPIAGEAAARQSAGPAVVRKAALHADPAAA